MWHTFGRAIDTCFAQKNQLSVTASGELFLYVTRIKTSVVRGISIYKAAEHWEQCMFHALGMLFAGASEPSCYIFPLVPHATKSDLPGETAYSQDEAIMYWENLDDNKEDISAPKRVRGRPHLSKYINDVITEVTSRAANSSAPLPPDMTAGLTIHSLRRGAAAYANACPKLAIQRIFTREAWLMDSLTKVFAYVGTTTCETQSVNKGLAGYSDPHLPCVYSIHPDAEGTAATPGLRAAPLVSKPAFQYVCGFTYAGHNVHDDVLDAVMVSLLIHLENVFAAVEKEQAATGFTSHYIYRLHIAHDATNAVLGSGLTLSKCSAWGSQLRTAWETQNFAQLGNCGSDTALLASAVMQMLSSITTMQRTLTKLVTMQEQREALRVESLPGTQGGPLEVPMRTSVISSPRATRLLDASTLTNVAHSNTKTRTICLS